ncbi:MAG: PilN domain-containing protein [Alphaproteobacteria bacterium]
MALISQGINRIRWFFRWWGGELAALVPGAIRRFFRARPDTVMVDISGPEVVVARCGENDCEEIGRFAASIGNEDEASGAARDILKAAGAARHRTALRLSSTQALRKSLMLPMAAEGELRNILSHQIEQHTPFQADEACFGYRVEARDRRARQITVELTVVPRKFVDAALARARRWGLEPDVVDISTDAPLGPPRINLIAGNGGGGANAWPKVNGMLAVVALSLALAAVVIPLENARDRSDALLGEVAELRRASQQVLVLRRERDALAKRVRFIADKKLKAPSALAVLDELTRIIPKDTWLYEFRINRPEIRISGYSPSASSLLGKINDSPMFSNPRFRSPVTRPGNFDKERFNLSFELGFEPRGEAK